MTHDELTELVHGSLDRRGDTEAWSSRSGGVLASGLATIRPGRLYVLGINPGGREDDRQPILANLHASEGTNAYADECWTCRTLATCTHHEDGRLRPKARTPFQTRACDLFDVLGVAPSEVLTTNLIFARSTELSRLRGSRAEWRRRCWPVHRALLREVRPHWIVTLGFGEAFSGVRGWGEETCRQQPIVSGGMPVAWHRRVCLDLGGGDRLEVGVLGVAHPGNRGFAQAGLAGTLHYPDALRRFIDREVVATPAA